MMHRKKLKLALVSAELSHWRVASAANKLLPEEFHLSEFDITRLVCGRKNPKPEQAEALASVLLVSVPELFPELGKEVSNVRKPEPNRCRRCGKFCGETYGATDSDKMSKRAASLRCETCTCKALAPEKDGGSK